MFRSVKKRGHLEKQPPLIATRNPAIFFNVEVGIILQNYLPKVLYIQTVVGNGISEPSTVS